MGDDACCEWYVPNVIGDSFGVPRVGIRGQRYINFPTHITKVADNNLLQEFRKKQHTFLKAVSQQIHNVFRLLGYN